MQIFSSAPCSETLSIRIAPLMWEAMVRSRLNYQTIYVQQSPCWESN
jgi:hypothetical protein